MSDPTQAPERRPTPQPAPRAKAKRSSASRLKRKVRQWIITGVAVPLLTAGLGAGGAVAVPLIQNSASPPAATQPDSTSSRCKNYEQYVIQPLAQSDPAAADEMLKSGSPIDKLCGF